MAASLVTISGTSGKVLLKYKIGANSYEIVTGIGTFYIESTATDITYTTLSGDAIASSGALTITALNYSYYKFFWKGLIAKDYAITDVIIDNIEISISEIRFPDPQPDVFYGNINTLNLEECKITDYKTLFSNSSIEISTGEYSFIMRTLGTIIPKLKIRNADNTGHIYLHGEVVSYPVTGYNSINICEIVPT